MRLHRYAPSPALAPYLETMWAFESPTGIPSGDLNVGVPNGKGKFIVPFQGNLTAHVPGAAPQLLPEAAVGVVGLLEKPVILEATGSIGLLGIEFKPSAAHHFFPGPMHEVTNQVLTAPDLFGITGRRLQDQLAEATGPAAKLVLLEKYLLARLTTVRASPAAWLVSYATAELQRHRGQLRIEDLARHTGYSRRYLATRFNEELGTGPKTMASIFRFQHVYQNLAAGDRRADFYEYYHDQAHFIKDFRRFAGRTPAVYLRQTNAFGELFYH